MTVDLGIAPDRAPRVVLDTAVVVSALVFGGGAPSALRRAWQRGRCRPMVCKATLLDLQQQLGHPRLGFTAQEQAALLAEYLRDAGRVRVPEALDGEPIIGVQARLAQAGKAHAVVTADPSLLAQPTGFPCPVLTLDGFIEVLDALRAQRRALRASSHSASP